MRKYEYKGITVEASTKKEAVTLIKEKLLDIEVTSMATVVKTPSMSICTSDDKDHIGKPYFKVYKGKRYENAEKMCRISFLEPKYIKEHSNNNGAENWELNSKERKQLMKLLMSKSDTRSNLTAEFLTNWELAIEEFNREKGTSREKIENKVLESLIRLSTMVMNTLSSLKCQLAMRS